MLYKTREQWTFFRIIIFVVDMHIRARSLSHDLGESTEFANAEHTQDISPQAIGNYKHIAKHLYLLQWEVWETRFKTSSTVKYRAYFCGLSQKSNKPQRLANLNF